MAKVIIELDTDNPVDEQLLRHITHHQDISIFIDRIKCLRWKHIESVEKARESVADILSPIYDLFE